MNHKQQLIIFTRFPEPGKTKTRLIPYLGMQGAAQLQKEMTEYTVRQARETGADVEIRFAGGSREQMRDWLGDDLHYAEQGEGDLGRRMQRAFEDYFHADAAHVVVIGSDCPSNGWTNMLTAFDALKINDGVIGPANDGGYYLIGLCRAGSETSPTLFQNIDWSGDRVFEQTMKAASNLSVHLLPELKDVDLPEDIPQKISVIIPALNEASYITETLDKVRDGFNVEAIVVDGGSTDATQGIAVGCLQCTGGRAAQQNLGAANAGGQLLLFLHADTELPDGWDWMVRETLSDPGIALGAFAFKIREQIRGLKFIEDTTNWRSKRRGLPYGDQGLFMRKEIFKQAGGFPDMPIMEDYAFVRSLRRFGKIVTLPQPAITSGRRWQRHGVIKVTAINRLMIIGYHLGISPDKLAHFYRKH